MRVLKPGGRLTLPDIISEKELPEGVSCNATLWATCIGGAMQQDKYLAAIATAGLKLVALREYPRDTASSHRRRRKPARPAA